MKIKKRDILIAQAKVKARLIREFDLRLRKERINKVKKSQMRRERENKGSFIS